MRLISREIHISIKIFQIDTIKLSISLCKAGCDIKVSLILATGTIATFRTAIKRHLDFFGRVGASIQLIVRFLKASGIPFLGHVNRDDLVSSSLSLCILGGHSELVRGSHNSIVVHLLCMQMILESISDISR